MPQQSRSDRTHAAGNPILYRINAATVWWPAGLFFFPTGCGRVPGSSARGVFLVIAVGGTIALVARIARRGLLRDLIPGGRRDPRPASTFFAWLTIGNPFAGRAAERALSVVTILGLAFLLVGPLFGGPC